MFGFVHHVCIKDELFGFAFVVDFFKDITDLL